MEKLDLRYQSFPSMKLCKLFAVSALSFAGLMGYSQAATFEVTNCNDAGPGSLRDAIASANANADADVIAFSAALGCSQVTLTSGQLVITNALTITGPGAAALAISGNKASRVFYINAPSAPFDVKIAGLTIRDGVAVTSINRDGGGIYVNWGPVLTLSDVIVTNNEALRYGGGVFSKAGFNMDRTTISANKAAYGGGVALLTPSPMLNFLNSSILGNAASQDGGGIYMEEFDEAAGGLISNVTISGNTAGGMGGGFYAGEYETSGPTVKITNTTIVNNSATTGGGIIIEYSTPTVGPIMDSAVVANNTATNAPDMSGNFVVTNSLIRNDAGWTLVGASGGNLPAGTDPKLRSLANNGGPTLTYLPFSDSPLINAGSNTAALTSDQRGGARVINGRADIGAVEWGALPQDIRVVAAVDDDFKTNPFKVQVGGVTASVLANDAVNGAAATPLNVTLSQVGQWPGGLSLTSEGFVAVGTAVAAGTYAVTYQICLLPPDNTTCATAVASVVVTPLSVVAAADDDFKTNPFKVQVGGVTASVLANDTVNGAAATPQNVSLSQVGQWPAGVSLSPEGVITVSDAVTAGTYALSYQICMLPPDNATCGTAVATVTVSNASAATAVPTLGEWGLMGLSFMLLMLGCAQNRRFQR